MTMYSRDSEEYKKISRCLAVVGGTNVANSVITSEAFQDLILALNPAYPIPGVSHLGKAINQLFLEMKAKVKSHLISTRRVTFCTDLWERRECQQAMLA